MNRKRTILQASQTRIDFAVTVINEQDDNVTINIMSILNLTFILMLFWRLTTAISYVVFGFTLLAISFQQALDTPVKVLQILANSFAFGFGLAA